MTTLNYTLTDGKQLEISWQKSWKNLTVKYDGELIGTVKGVAQLRAGQTFKLSSDSIAEKPRQETYLPSSNEIEITVRLLQGQLSSSSRGLQILYNGRPLPGTAVAEDIKLKDATGCIFIIALFSLLLGLLTLSFSLLAGTINIGVALLFLVLLVYIRRKSEMALVVVIVAYLLDTVLTVGVFISQGNITFASVSGIILRIVALSIMFSGLNAIKTWHQQYWVEVSDYKTF